MAATLRLTNPLAFLSHPPTPSSLRFRGSKSIGTETASSFMAATAGSDPETTSSSSRVIDSHLHIWASPQEAAAYPYFPGQEPTLTGDVSFLLKNMEEARVDGALIVQPINHKFDHSLVTSVVKKYPWKFVGCCLANPAEDGSGIKDLENLVLESNYRAVRFNPYLWPPGQKMTNAVGKAMFSKAGELGVPVGFMCMKGLHLHIAEIEELCTEFPKTTVILDHAGFCKVPENGDAKLAYTQLMKLSRFPQVYVKFSALFRLSRTGFPYQDLSPLLSQAVSHFGANRVMWGSDFPFVVLECGYKEAREAVAIIADQASLSSSDMDWILGKTVMQLFPGQWDLP
uniref:4-sulfomuconolactone hydrolase n=1 Tax=Noccaea caerulescens TaxID=107243 RepID=A0A1J3EJA2_NOCCA